MIVLVPGIVAGIVGFIVALNLGLVRSLLIACASAALLYSVSWGVLFAEFPVGLVLGGIGSLGRRFSAR